MMMTVGNANNLVSGSQATYGVLNSTKRVNYPNSFSDTLFDKVEKNRDIDIPKKESFRPDSSKEVMDAWDKTLEETGIDPFPMNKISTALVISVENGTQGLSSTFLGDSIASAKNFVEQIIERLENPLDPSDVTQFSNNEKIFYKRFLKNLGLAEQ